MTSKETNRRFNRVRDELVKYFEMIFSSDSTPLQKAKEEVEKIASGANEQCEYTIDEAIAEIEGWYRGKRIYPIELAISALYWIEKSPQIDDGSFALGSISFNDIIVLLKEWLGNEKPDLPDDIIDASLYWLQKAR